MKYKPKYWRIKKNRKGRSQDHRHEKQPYNLSPDNIESLYHAREYLGLQLVSSPKELEYSCTIFPLPVSGRQPNLPYLLSQKLQDLKMQAFTKMCWSLSLELSVRFQIFV